MRILWLFAPLLGLACATSAPGSDNGSPQGGTATSVASMGTGSEMTSPVIRVQAGDVRVTHTVPPGARLRATILEGLDATNRQVRYEWDQNGTYSVAVSGRYRHSVTGSILGAGSLRIRSTLTYTPVADTSVAAVDPLSAEVPWRAAVSGAPRIPPGPDRPTP